MCDQRHRNRVLPDVFKITQVFRGQWHDVIEGEAEAYVFGI